MKPSIEEVIKYFYEQYKPASDEEATYISYLLKFAQSKIEGKVEKARLSVGDTVRITNSITTFYSVGDVFIIKRLTMAGEDCNNCEALKVGTSETIYIDNAITRGWYEKLRGKDDDTLSSKV